MSRKHQQPMRFLIGEIVSGRLAEGEFLPREADVGDEFGVSRGVARECIRGLEERGMVSVKHGRGATVNPQRRWSRFDADVIAALLAGDASAGILAEYLECRRVLEIHAAGLAAERATGGDIELLSDVFDRMTESAQAASLNPAAEERYYDDDIAFHRAVIQATGNAALGQMTEPIHHALAMAIRLLARPRVRIERALPEHRRILAAIAQSDAEEARAAMRDHLLTVELYLQEYAAGANGGASAR